ncbi:MAG TPA: retropepsin-like aspartic protease [Xanthomonadaceae bacterium]|jgi:hypothetical protein|nr:retropepsin-like aspartic protease [Xanthomonadaceae bacterium]
MRATTLLAASISLILATAAHAAPDAAQILRANAIASGGETLDNKAAMKIESAISGQGLTGTDVLVVDLKDGRSLDSSTLGPSSETDGYDGKQAWTEDSSGTVNIESGGDALPLAVNNAYRNANLWWRADFGGATVKIGDEKADGDTHYDVLTITPKDGKPFDAWFDTKTHLLARTIERQGSQTVTVAFSDYRVVEGMQMPYKTVIDSGNGAKYLQTVTLTKAQFVDAQQDSAYAPPTLTVKDFSIAGGATQTQFPFRLINNHIYTDVAVNGQGPLLFIVDSGGLDILTPATAKTLGVKVEGAMPGTGVGDKATDYGLSKVDTLEVGDAIFQHQVLGVLDFVPNAVEGVDIKGMLGFEVFKRFVTRIDYGAHTITLIDPKSFDPTDAGTPVKFVFNGDLPEVNGSFDGIPAQFDVDTGARDELTLTAPFAESNDLRAKLPHGVETVEGWGAGGSARG